MVGVALDCAHLNFRYDSRFFMHCYNQARELYLHVISVDNHHLCSINHYIKLTQLISPLKIPLSLGHSEQQ